MTSELIAGAIAILAPENIAIFSYGCYDVYDAPIFNNGYRRYIKIIVGRSTLSPSKGVFCRLLGVIYAESSGRSIALLSAIKAFDTEISATPNAVIFILNCPLFVIILMLFPHWIKSTFRLYWHYRRLRR